MRILNIMDIEFEQLTFQIARSQLALTVVVKKGLILISSTGN